MKPAAAPKEMCPQGMVPEIVAGRAPRLAKGNPLLGPERRRPDFTLEWYRERGEAIRKNLRRFSDVYRKLPKGERYQPKLLPPDPAGECGGVSNSSGCYYYASAGFRTQSDGGGMTLSIEKPSEDGISGHTLDEIAVQGGTDDGDIIEVGWNVSSDQYGNANPHLFVFHWKGWTPTCYDGCGWQQWSNVYTPGMDLSAHVGRKVYAGFVYWEGNWWAWFDNQWLGYFPGTEWNGGYTKNALIQWFGEVATGNQVPSKMDMGNGQFPSAAGAASMVTLCDVDAPAWVCWYRDQQLLSATVPAYYDILRTGFGATRDGGPGE